MKSFAESTLAPHSPKMSNARLSGSDISNPEQTVDLYQFGGRYGKLKDDSAEISSDDGITHKGKSLQIKFNFVRNENNKYTVTAKIA